MRSPAFKTSIFTVILFIIMIFNPVIDLSEVAVSVPPPPDDGIDGLQVIDGDWHVYGWQNYTDEIIELNGNLIIHNNSVLQFKNVTLRMNVTSAINVYSIEVYTNATFSILDVDDDPSTTFDASNITDSIYDIDNLQWNASDFRYYFKVHEGGILNIRNSNVREVGTVNPPSVEEYGIYADTSKITISNSTFSNCYYALYAVNDYDEGNMSLLIDNCTVYWCIYGFRMDNMKKIELKNSYFYNYQYRAVQLFDVHYSNILNNTFYNQTGNDVVVYTQYSSNLFFSGCLFNVTKNRVLYLDYNERIFVQNNTWRKTGHDGVYNYAYYRSYFIFKHNRLYDVPVSALYSNRASNVYYIENYFNNTKYAISSYAITDSKIERNIIHNYTYRGINLDQCDRVEIRNNYLNGTIGTDWCIIYYNSRTSTIENNTLIKPRYGIYQYYDSGPTLVQNNIIQGRGQGSSSYGLHPERCGRQTYINNIISGFDLGIVASFTNYYYTELPLNIYGGSMTDCKNPLYMRYRSYVNTYNVTFDNTKTYWYSASYGPWLNVYNDLYVHVQDTTGPVGGALVNVTNATGLMSYTAHTPKTGWVLFSVLNGTYQYGSSFYHRPYNISANISGVVGYSETEYDGNGWRRIYVNFTSDIVPSSPFNLRYSINRSNVRLDWECYVNDLSSYRILRRTEYDIWQEVGNITSPEPDVNQTWEDTGHATDLKEYHYKIYHMDSLGQEGVNELYIVFDDWVFTTYNKYSDQNLSLNGSLVIEDSGILELENISLSMNELEPVGNDRIEVRSGGKLILRDRDNDPDTKNDMTTVNVTPMKQPYTYGFVVREGGELEVHNSLVRNASNYISDIDEACGIHADSGVIHVVNSNIVVNDIGIYLDSSNGSLISGSEFDNNKITRYDKAVRSHNSENITLEDNIFRRSLTAEVYIESSSNILITRNDFLCENATSIYSIATRNIVIENNTFDKSQRAVSLNEIEAGTIKDNDFYRYKNEGLLLYRTTSMEVRDNKFHETIFSKYAMYLNETIGCYVTKNIINNAGLFERGIYCDSNINLTLYDNEVFDTYIGIQVVDTEITDSFTLIKGNKIHDTQGSGFGLYLFSSSGFDIIENTIYDTNYGIYLKGNSNHRIDDNSIYNCTYGVYQEGGISNLFHGNLMWESQYSFDFRSGARATVYNCTILGSPVHTVYLKANTNIILINPLFNLSRVNISDNTCSIVLQYAFELIVYDQFGQKQKDIFVRIRNIFGTIMLERYTDDQGNLPLVTLTNRIMYYKSNTSYTPHTFEAQLGNHDLERTIAVQSSKAIYLTLDNSAPSAFNIMITPLTPRSKDDLELSYVFSDPELDTNAGTMIKWYKNGLHQPSLDGLLMIDHSYTNKGDLWYAKITPYDGVDYGITSTSSYAWILNTKPSVSNVVLKPSGPNSLEDLWVNYTYFDDDGDVESGTIFRWYQKSGSDYIYKEVTNTPVLNYSKTVKNDIWQVRIEPRDGESFGDIVQSNDVLIGNTPPTVENATISPEAPTSSEDITVVYDFVDMDGDSEGLTKFTWLKYPVGGTNFTEEGNYTGKTVPKSALFKGDRWRCTITPHDGNIYGTAVNSTDVVIENTAPQIYELRIIPANPMTYNDLDVTYNYADYDGDAEGGTSFEWLKWSETGKAFLKTGLNLKRLPSVFTQRDQIWLCEVTPKDGLTFGTPVRSEPAVIGNSRPSVSSLVVVPELPRTYDDLHATYDYFDDNNDPEKDSTIYWFKNGVRQMSLDNALLVDHTLTSKGERWYFTVIPNDGLLPGSQRSSPEIEILNSAPVVKTPKITTLFPRGDEDLEISYEYYDPDDDELNRTEIIWYRNGERMKIYNNFTSIPASATEKDQSWYFDIQVFDGQETSAFNRSFPVTIRNSKPMFTSLSPGQDHIYLVETENTEFRVEVVDFDGDVVFFKWVIKDILKAGTKDAGEDANFIYETNYASAGEYLVNVTVQDWGVNSFKIYKEWRVSIANKNRPPVIRSSIPLEENSTIDIGESIKFVITPIDQDVDDEQVITWYFDGIEVATETDTYTYISDAAAVGKHVVVASVSDGYTSTNKSWNVTVRSGEEGQRLIYGLTWDQWSVFIQVIVIVASAILGFLGFHRLRKKRGVLQDYMKQVETPMKTWRENPDMSEKELIKVEEHIDHEYRLGQIEDLHFFLIDRQIKQNLSEIRQGRVDERFEYLPPEITSEITKILEDGKITDTEFNTFSDMLDHTMGMRPDQKDGLKSQMRFWRDVDKDRVERKGVSKAHEKKKKKKKARMEKEQEKREKREKKELEKQKEREEKEEKKRAKEIEDKGIPEKLDKIPVRKKVLKKPKQ